MTHHVPAELQSYVCKHIIPQYARFRKHLTDKYAEGGYLKLWIPQSDNAGRLAELRNLIANEGKLIKVFDKLYSDELG